MYHFAHNEQSVRVVEYIERQGKGLNLTWEVRDGILNHKTAGTPHTLEGQVLRLSDKIAYINHDIDDAVRGGILTEEEIPKEIRNTLGDTGKRRLDTMVHDVIVHSMDRPEILMSEEVGQAMKELRKFMFYHVYLNPKAKGEEDKAVDLIHRLYEYYLTHLELLPEQFLHAIDLPGNCREQIVCDYIAGMTDNYAVKKYEEYFMPEAWSK